MYNSIIQLLTKIRGLFANIFKAGIFIAGCAIILDWFFKVKWLTLIPEVVKLGKFSVSGGAVSLLSVVLIAWLWGKYKI